MTSPDYNFENPGPPIEPDLRSIGRSIADRWVIRTLIIQLISHSSPTEIAGMINWDSADINEKVEQTLELEFRLANEEKYNSCEVRKEAEDRIEYIVDQLKSMQKAIQGEGDRRILLFDEPVLECR